MGHEQASTTLNRYTHPSDDQEKRVQGAFADDPLTPGDPQGSPEPDKTLDRGL